MKYCFYLIIFLFLGCTGIFKNESLEILDSNNDGYDDRDIFFLEKLINNSQGFNFSTSANPINSGANALKFETETVTNSDNNLREDEILDENININSDIGAAESMTNSNDASLILEDEAIENKEDSNGLENFGIEEETPDLFDSNNEVSELPDESNSQEEDEFEIPAFLRRQKN